jgi:hypothetical protein
MTQRFCCYIDYSQGETACEKLAHFEHGDAWLCAEHYDLAMDYVSGKPTAVFGYDLGLNQEPVFSIAYKKLDKNSDFDV